MLQRTKIPQDFQQFPPKSDGRDSRKMAVSRAELAPTFVSVTRLQLAATNGSLATDAKLVSVNRTTGNIRIFVLGEKRLSLGDV